MQCMIQSDTEIVVCLFPLSGLLLYLLTIEVLTHCLDDLEAYNVFLFFTRFIVAQE